MQATAEKLYRAVNDHLAADWLLIHLAYVDRPDRGIYLKMFHKQSREAFETRFRFSDYKTLADMIDAINYDFAMTNLFVNYPKLGIHSVTQFTLDPVIRMNGSMVADEGFIVRNVRRFYDPQTCTLATETFNECVNEAAFKDWQKYLSIHPGSQQWLKKPKHISFGDTPPYIRGPLALTEEIVAKYPGEIILTAPHHPGFGKAVYISGADTDYFNDWKYAIRCTYDAAKDVWFYKVPASLSQREYKFLIGDYDIGNMARTANLEWEAGMNREIPFPEKSVTPSLRCC